MEAGGVMYPEPEFPLHMRVNVTEMEHADEMTVEQMVALAKRLAEERREPEHPQFIEGTFYLTEEQWNAIRAEFPEARDKAAALGGYPVKVLRPYEDTVLPSGRVLLFSGALNALCLVDPSAMPDPVPHPRRIMGQ